MKVSLIIPRDNQSANPFVYPPLGLLYIAGILEKDGFDVSIIDFREEGVSVDSIPVSDAYGITATTPQIDHAKQIAASLHEREDAFTVIGGPYVSWLPEDTKDQFSATIIGEGESVVSDVFRNKKRGVIPQVLPPCLDSIPDPSRHLMPDERIVSQELWQGYRFGNGPSATTIVSSRSCPYKCAFCANIPATVRFRSPEHVIAELENIVDRYGCKHFRFLDDNLILNRKRFRKLAKLMEPLGIRYRCSARSNLITEEMCDLLISSGCEEIGLGIESGDDTVLSVIQKQETVSQHKDAINTIKRSGLRVKVFLMAGLPGETWEAVYNTERFIQETKPDKWIITLFTPYPGSPIFHDPERFGVTILDNDFKNYVQTYPTKSTIRTDVASSEELGEHFDYLLKVLENYERQ